MNRQQRRAAWQQIRSKNTEQAPTMVYGEFLESIAKKNRTLKDGEIVRLNYDRIVSNPNWVNMQPRYKVFVEAHKDLDLTACTDSSHPGFVCFEEDAAAIKWLWMEDDLIKAVDD